MPQSIFSQEWRDCLRAHYTYVVRVGDQGTERTLRGVMIEAGFGEDEVKQLYVLATAHVDDVAEDFVPDMEMFEAAPPLVEALPVVEAVEVEVEAVEDETEQADQDEADQAAEEEADLDEPPPDPGITQLSLF